MKHILLSLFLSLFMVALANAQVANRPSGLLAQNETLGKGKLSIYPNPAVDYIELTETDEVAQLIIYNVVGRRLITFDFVEGQKYNVSDLPDGMYLIQFLGYNNKILSTQRLSKR